MKYHIKQQGFSLVEVMVAMAVFSFGLIGVLLLQNYALQYNQAAFDKILLTTASNSFLDDLKVSIKDAGNNAATHTAVLNRTVTYSGLSSEQANLIPTFPAAGAGQFQQRPLPVTNNSSIQLNVSQVASEQKTQALEDRKQNTSPVAIDRQANFQKLF